MPTYNTASSSSSISSSSQTPPSSVDDSPTGRHGQLRPNILYIMADQMSAPLLKMHDPNSPIQTPNIDHLAETGVVFDRAYCNAPLCAPSRFCMVSGQLPSKIKAYDNASTLPSDIPTYAHYLRTAGYETVLAGKMHFIGADQLHGYEQRLTPDIYPGDFGWSVNWDRPDERQEWYHTMASVLEAGPCVRSNQLDYDEEVMYKSTQYLYDHVRQSPKTKRPFCLTVSLTHPHDPYTITKNHWDQYDGVDIPMPKVRIDQDKQDAHSQRLLKAIELWDNPMQKEAIQRARRAYFGACSYVDVQIGKLLQTLKECELEDDTIIIFSGDHGDMLGERNLWYKMSWFEMSARVPLIFHYPKLFAPKRVAESVSTLDVLPTMVDLVGASAQKIMKIDGRSLYGAITGRAKAADEVFGEYMGEGTVSPIMMIRRGRYKYITCLTDSPQLYDLHDDPLELNNLALSSSPDDVKTLAAFKKEAELKWDFEAIHQDTLRCQRQRRICWQALKQGHFEAWDFEPQSNARGKYIRSNMDLNELELRARFPMVK